MKERGRNLCYIDSSSVLLIGIGFFYLIMKVSELLDIWLDSNEN